MILSDRTIEDMLGSAGRPTEAEHWRGATQSDGWREPLASGQGFRHHYDEIVGDGGWEFHQLNDALSVAVVDFRAACAISRSHRHDDHLVFCAMLEGRSPISTGSDPVGEDDLAHGFCTFFGLSRGDAVHTVYEANRSLRYVTVFLRCDRMRDVLGIDVEALPAIFRDYIVEGIPIGLRHVPLASGASIAATQVFECPYEGELRRLYFIAKALEIACSVIQSYAEDSTEANGPVLRRGDVEKLKLARQLIETNLDEPLGVADLAATVGLTVKKLQHGFQVLFRGSVGQVYKQVRLSKAMVLVSKSDISMLDIAIECGYECPGSFARAFKLAFGASPTSVRAMTLPRASAQTDGADKAPHCPRRGSLVN
ncbi:AraC family transcriptional regulator [Pelomonas sp. KK5]|uniref:helix-turn-helix transcriptional regulator n=1 Tax=Pelomonas sp. KK5 TaxID=1855730 RepID=UPI00097C5DDD|nr:AraC family transcriptional regulator [Pelomonas sp. KK5]